MAVLNFSVIAVKPVRNVPLGALAARRDQTEPEEDHTAEQWASAFTSRQGFFLMVLGAAQESAVHPPLSLFIIGGARERRQIATSSLQMSPDMYREDCNSLTWV